ncbi:hypothetical protein F4808DRAFT_410919 [Astrocystis sublimbata]|nr:hypothetical protein F4808DRAFT_410919 [Astrocystis sublimbata]
MASITARQPFAPLNEARLHTLTSLKNRQNSIASPSPVKRKASDVTELDNSENVDPVLFSKRAKGTDGSFTKDSFIKPSNFFLTKSASSNDLPVSNVSKPATPLPRAFLNPKSPASRLNSGPLRSSPLSAPAGRPLTRKRSGGLRSSRRRTGGSSFTRVDPPTFGISSSSVAPFSLDAALKGTIPSYNSSDVPSKKSSSSSSDFSGLHEPEMKSSWFFEIHEDTVIENMTNELDHKASGLDIMSEEEQLRKAQEEYEESKENHPPLDDVSQTAHPRVARSVNADEMAFEKERNPLGEMDPKDYYSTGCDENSIIIVPGDEDEEVPSQNNQQFVAETKHSVSVEIEKEADPAAEQERLATVEELMQKTDQPAPSAAVLEPIEGTGESFEVWESSSAKDETEAATEC